MTKRPAPHDLRSLIRQPIVLLMLLTTAALQVATVRSGAEPLFSKGELRTGTGSPAVVLDPVVVNERSWVQDAWLERTILRESQLIAAEYRNRGYPVSPQLAKQIGEAAAEFRIDPKIAFGLVRAESSFRTTATSPVGAIGLTQLMPKTASWVQPGITRAQLRDPETNLRVGFKYLRYLLNKYDGDERLALLAYNRGPGTVDRALRQGRSPDNGYADFVNGVKNHGHTLFSSK